MIQKNGKNRADAVVIGEGENEENNQTEQKDCVAEIINN